MSAKMAANGIHKPMFTPSRDYCGSRSRQSLNSGWRLKGIMEFALFNIGFLMCWKW